MCFFKKVQCFFPPTGAFHEFGNTPSMLLNHSTYLQCLCVQAFCPKSCLQAKPALTKHPESDQYRLLLHFCPCGFYLRSLGLTLFPAIQQKDSPPVNPVAAFQHLLSYSYCQGSGTDSFTWPAPMKIPACLTACRAPQSAADPFFGFVRFSCSNISCSFPHLATGSIHLSPCTALFLQLQHLLFQPSLLWLSHLAIASAWPSVESCAI